MNNESNLIQFAKQGNADAIRELLSVTLNKNKINIEKCIFQDGCLKLLLSSVTILSVDKQDKITNFIYQYLSKLNINSLITVKIYGKKIGEDFHDWEKELNLKQESSIKNKQISSNDESEKINYIRKNNNHDDNNNMATCPECGNQNIILKNDVKANWGRGLVGLALFGLVGGAVAIVDKQDVNYCLQCATSWDAITLYKTIQLVKKTTDIKLNLSYEKDRKCLQYFIDTIIPVLEEINNSEKSNNSIYPSTNTGCQLGFYLSAAILFFAYQIGMMTNIFSALLVLIITPFIGGLIGSSIDNKNRAVLVENKITIEKENQNKLENLIKFFKEQYYS